MCLIRFWASCWYHHQIWSFHFEPILMFRSSNRRQSCYIWRSWSYQSSTLCFRLVNTAVVWAWNHFQFRNLHSFFLIGEPMVWISISKLCFDPWFSAKPTLRSRGYLILCSSHIVQRSSSCRIDCASFCANSQCSWKLWTIVLCLVLLDLSKCYHYLSMSLIAQLYSVFHQNSHFSLVSWDHSWKTAFTYSCD